MAYLIDTDILIYSLRGNESVRRKIEDATHVPKRISLATYGELLYGAEKSHYSEKNRAAVARIRDLFPTIEIDETIMETYAMVKAHLAEMGKLIDDFDILIAATALAWNCTLVTHNTKHFENVAGLTIEDWAV